VVAVLGVAALAALIMSGRNGVDLQFSLAILASTAAPTGIAAAVLISANGVAARKVWLWAGAIVSMVAVMLCIGMLSNGRISFSLYGLAPVIVGWAIAVPIGLLATIPIYGFITRTFRS
jgi:hypothetical protein